MGNILETRVGFRAEFCSLLTFFSLLRKGQKLERPGNEGRGMPEQLRKHLIFFGKKNVYDRQKFGQHPPLYKKLPKIPFISKVKKSIKRLGMHGNWGRMTCPLYVIFRPCKTGQKEAYPVMFCY